MVKGKRGGRVRDKWHDKKWVVVQAPASFGNVPIAQIPVTDEEKGIGRVIEVTLYELWKTDPQQHTIKLYFQIERIDGDIAYTRFRGHEFAKEFLRSLIRRGSSMITYINDYTTQDGYKFRVSAIAFSQRRLNSSKKHEIRSIINEVLSSEIPQKNIDQFVQAVVGPELNARMHAKVKKIVGVRHISVRKTKLLQMPKTTVESVPMQAAAP
ncbi:MAG: 30S ribosomal protein S3ae [Nitrososphaerales archaeon]